MKITFHGFGAASFILIAASLFVDAASAADATAGKTIFAARCRTCHGAEGQGNPAMAKALNAELKPLGSDDIQKKSDADLKASITMGVGKMKPVALTGADLDNVVAFIRTLRK
jgi:mono/diheme cytochrome c family protein